VCRPCGTLRKLARMLRSFSRETCAVCSKGMILSGPESLEGQKIRDGQQEFSRLARATSSRAIHLFYREGQSPLFKPLLESNSEYHFKIEP
jgi:hypothetical protein